MATWSAKDTQSPESPLSPIAPGWQIHLKKHTDHQAENASNLKHFQTIAIGY
jgi:hypothetical protein